MYTCMYVGRSVFSKMATTMYDMICPVTTARQRHPCYPLMNLAWGLGFEAFLLYPAIIKLVHGAEQHLFAKQSEVE